MLREMKSNLTGTKIIPFFFLLFLFVASCKDKAPTAPEESTSAEVLAEKTIGPEGGTLETENFKLTVPNGAFTANTQLRLYAESDTVPFGEFGISKLFRVKGIAANFQQPLQIAIKYSGNLKGVNFIIIGIKDTIELIDTSFIDVRYTLLDAKESGGYISSEISVDRLGKSSLININATDAEIWLAALTGGKKEGSGHFKITGIVPNSQQASVNKIVEYFEEAYTRFNNAGFDYSNVSWPMEIEFIKKPKHEILTDTRCYLMGVTYYETITLSDNIRREIILGIHEASFIFL